MPDVPSQAETREQRLNEVLAEYLESGRTPDRAALLARYPDLAVELEEFFVNLDGLLHFDARVRASATVTLAKQTPVDTAALAPGSRLGDYEFVTEIARGGMGVVYRVRHLSLNREFALKMILGGRHSSAQSLRRFRFEAEAAAHLDHPNIVPIYEVGEIDGQPYLTMKLVERGSLSRRHRGVIGAYFPSGVASCHETVPKSFVPSRRLCDKPAPPRTWIRSTYRRT
jgi:Protein kinase domain